MALTLNGVVSTAASRAPCPECGRRASGGWIPRSLQRLRDGGTGRGAKMNHKIKWPIYQAMAGRDEAALSSLTQDPDRCSRGCALIGNI
jgi:hypothetical protein